MSDNEHEALRAVLELLDPLESDARERLIRTACTWYDIAAWGRSGSTPSSPFKAARDPDFTERADVTPKLFIFEKRPRTDVDRVACLAYYLQQYRDQQTFKTLDINKLNTEAAQVKFSNASVAVSNAARRGLLAPAGKGAKQLTAVGEQYVLALPDYPVADAALKPARSRRKKSAKKSSKKSSKKS